MLALLSCFAHAQDSSSLACAQALKNCDVQKNRSYEVVKSGLARKQSFILQDSCYCFNRIVDTVDMYRAYYHPAYILSREEVAKLETFLLSQPGAFSAKLRTLYRKYYRQYKAYRAPDNSVRVYVLFCTGRFLRKNKSFRFQSVWPMDINASRHPFFSCHISMAPGAAVKVMAIYDL